MNKTDVILKPFKCEECDSEFCEYYLWCKGKNVNKKE